MLLLLSGGDGRPATEVLRAHTWLVGSVVKWQDEDWPRWLFEEAVAVACTEPLGLEMMPAGLWGYNALVVDEAQGCTDAMLLLSPSRIVPG